VPIVAQFQKTGDRILDRCSVASAGIRGVFIRWTVKIKCVHIILQVVVRTTINLDRRRCPTPRMQGDGGCDEPIEDLMELEL
jgi:hypothetical protein